MSHDPLFMLMLKELDRTFGAKNPAHSRSNSLKYPSSTEASGRMDCADETSAPGLQERADCINCNDTGRRRDSYGCYGLERCWCVAGDVFERQESLPL